MDSTVLYIGGAVATAIGTVAWWTFRSMHGRISDVERDLSAYKLHVAEKYATTTELSKAMADLNESIKTLFTKIDLFRDLLDKKADK